MAAKFVVLFACVALASAGLVRRETSDPLEHFQKTTQGFLDTFAEQFNNLPIKQHSEEFHQKLKETSQTFNNQLTELGKNLESLSADAGAKLNQVLENNKQLVKKATDDLETHHSDVHEKAEQLKTTISNAVASTVEATRDLAKEVSTNVKDTGDKVAPQIKSAFDDFVKNIQEIQKNLLEASKKE